MSRGGGFFRDNIEAFAVAIAMALVIRHFCVEAFRIPTGSMMPTLLGDRAHTLSEGRRPGDRILVDKLAWLRRNPRRFEVAVFQYPLNRNKNFIKRIGGLPGDWLRIVDGDLWVSRDEGKTWHIQRKPAGTRDQLLFPYYPEPADKPGAFRNVRCFEADDGWKVDESAHTFRVDAQDATSGLEFARKVVPYPDVDNDGFASDPYVGDVRVAFELEVERGGELVVQLIKHGVPYRLTLSDGASHVEWGAQKKREALPFKLASGDVSFAFVDDTLFADCDGESFEFELPERTTPPTPDLFEGNWQHHAIRIEARGCKATLRDLRIDRDLHYTARMLGADHVWKIPEGYYFMLGDNTQHSKDSREWHIAEARRKDGSVIRWEPNPHDGTRNPAGAEPFGGPETELFVEADVDGHTRRFRSGEISSWVSSKAWPFVSTDHLIGRAFAVFWPVYLPPLSTSPTRVKLIR